MREQVEIGILDSQLQRETVNEELTIEGALQDLVESKIFESIDKQEQLGYIGEYEVKLKYNENNKVVIEYIQKSTGIRVTYALDPVGYTNTPKVNILFKVQGKVKSVTTPKGLIVYPKNEVVGIDHEVTANGRYKFIIEKEDGSTVEKEAIVDTIDTLPPNDFTITAKNTGTGFIITANVEDAEATQISVKSGIDKIEYYVKLSTATQYTKYETNNIEGLKYGTYNIYAIAYDKANNKTQTKVITAKVMDPLVEMYGKNVNYNVKVNGTTLDNWKVFYIDKKTKDTFLIYGDYLPGTCLPTSCGFGAYSSSYPYRAYWSNVPGLQTQCETYKNLFKYTMCEINAGSHTYQKHKCTSILLNTSNWTSFVDTNYADLAIGSPTLEMWNQSWINKGYKSLGIYVTSFGYRLSSEYVGNTDDLYFPRKKSIKNCDGYFLTAPAYADNNYSRRLMMSVEYRGSVGIGMNCSSIIDGSDFSIRPLVHLKNGENGVELKWNTGTNKYDIINKKQ